MGGAGEAIEVDETYIGKLEGVEKAKSGAGHKNVVLTLVQRGGEARSFHIAGTRRYNIEGIVRANVKRDSILMTDEAHHYKAVGNDFASHDTVTHSKEEYVRYEGS